MRRLMLVLCLALPWAVPPAAAVAQDDPYACGAVAADADRLACYDAIFRAGQEQPGAPSLVIESNQLIPARPTGRGRATMTVACTDGNLEVGFAFAGQLLSETGDDAAISFQVQQTGNVVRNLPVTPDNRTIYFPSEAAGEAFLESIEGGDSLIVRITPPRQRSVQSQFDLRSHETEIAAIRTACR